MNPRKRNHDGKDDRRRPWLTKTAKKHLSQQQLSTYPDEEGSQSGDTDDEEGDTEHFSTDEEQDPETDQEDRIAHFFNAEDYQQLLTKCLSALDLKDKPQEEGATGATSGAIPPAVKGKYTHPGNTKWGSKDYFPKRLSTEKVFPFPIFFEEQLRAEWETPATTRRPPPSVKKLYALPKFTNDFLKVPVAEAPILDIQSSGLLSQDGLGSIKDSWDKRIEHSLCRTYDASSLSVGASATASIVARASIVWIKKLIDLIPPDDSRVQEGLSRILKANSFVALATLDSLVFTSRAMAASVYARRSLWLRAWQVDNKSKQMVAAYPFTGEKLFGPLLENILVETRDKRKALPKSLRRPDRRGRQGFTPNSTYSFRSSFTARSRSDGRRVSWSTRPRFRRPFRDNRPPFQKTQDRQFRQEPAGTRKQRKT